MRGVQGDGKPASPQGQFAELARAGGRGALVTVMRGPNPGARMLVRPDGSTEGGLGDEALARAAAAHADELMWAERSEARDEGDVLLFVDVVFPAPRLFVSSPRQSTRMPARSSSSSAPTAASSSWR